ncbi:MAG TPA: RHS repeat-associated core domain-containing protein [Anaerolineae bacterium]|nr:RHS repeat-associated core domain-containing protein [Anaerolineae bacterium]
MPDPALGRFLQADTLVPNPGNPQSLNRYAYTLNNPLRYTDPSGHWIETAWDIANIGWDIYEVQRDPGNAWNWAALVLDVGAAVLPVVPGGVGLVVRGGKALSHADEVVDAGRVLAEAASHADEVVDVAQAANRLDDTMDVLRGVENAAEAAGHRSPTVIGENMERVRRYAKQIGGETIDDWLAGRTWTRELNDEFIAAVNKEGREVIDIGPDFDRRLRHCLDPADPLGRPPSLVYGSERRQLLGYENYRRAYGRFWKYGGGVPGLDY